MKTSGLDVHKGSIFCAIYHGKRAKSFIETYLSGNQKFTF
jgi:hypothetical protein